jgi:hypothetical protein
MKSINRLAFLTLVVVGSLILVQPVIAHHSGAGFNSAEVKEVTGTIKEFQFKNPHVWIQVLVRNAEGQEEEWSVEWGSPNVLARQGVRPSTFPPGATVTMRVNPMLNGAPAGGFIGAKFADGTSVGRWQE